MYNLSVNGKSILVETLRNKLSQPRKRTLIIERFITLL